MSVFHSESLWDRSQLNKADPLVQMSCVKIGFHHRIELQHLEAERFRSLHTVQNQLFTDMQPSAAGSHGVARVADMSASADVVRVKDV